MSRGPSSAVSWTPRAASELSVALPGRRGERPDAGELTGLDSVRELAAWFGPSDAIAVIALRPSQAQGPGAGRAPDRRRRSRGGGAHHRSTAVNHLHGSRARAAGSASALRPTTEEQPPPRLAGEALHRGARVSAPRLGADGRLAGLPPPGARRGRGLPPRPTRLSLGPWARSPPSSATSAGCSPRPCCTPSRPSGTARGARWRRSGPRWRRSKRATAPIHSSSSRPGACPRRSSSALWRRS